MISTVWGDVDRSPGSSKVYPAVIERIHVHRVPEDIDVAVFLRQSGRQRLPFVTAGPAPVDAQVAFIRVVLGIALHRDDIDRFGFVGVHTDRESEIAGQVAAHIAPGISPVVAAHDVPVALHEQQVRSDWMHREPMDAVTHLGIGFRHVVGMQAPVDRLPGTAAVQGTEGTGHGNSYD